MVGAVHVYFFHEPLTVARTDRDVLAPDPDPVPLNALNFIHRHNVRFMDAQKITRRQHIFHILETLQSHDPGLLCNDPQVGTLTLDI